MSLKCPVVLDNTVLTNFALAGSTELVLRLWGEAACTTPDVLAEYQKGVSQGSVPEDCWKDLATVELETEEETCLGDFSSRLGPGERSCLAVVSHRGGVLVTDDRHARKTAATMDVAITGTIGILIACVRKNLIDLREANRLLKVMIDHGYRSPADRLDDYVASGG